MMYTFHFQESKLFYFVGLKMVKFQILDFLSKKNVEKGLTF